MSGIAKACSRTCSAFMATALSILMQIVVDDAAEIEGEIGDGVDAGDHLAHRQLGDRGERMRAKLERRGARPCALEHDLSEAITHQLANARRAVDMRHDFQEKSGLCEQRIGE